MNWLPIKASEVCWQATWPNIYLRCFSLKDESSFFADSMQLSKSDADTELIGADILRNCLKIFGSSAVITLEGPLGAGKTTLVRGMLRSLGYEGPVKSPTFTLLESYAFADRSLKVFHFDLYRILDELELEFIGLEEILDSDGIKLFEWPDRASNFLMLPRVRIVLDVPKGPFSEQQKLGQERTISACFLEETQN